MAVGIRLSPRTANRGGDVLSAGRSPGEVGLGTFRFLLALAVVVSHAGGLWGRRYMDGLMAVQCFYMVSGFLISLILSGKYDTSTPSGLRLFYTTRALRIFVPYWTFF